MTENRVNETYMLGPRQCGNQLAYGLPGSEYCANYKAPDSEWCQECCDSIAHDSPGTNVRWRVSEPFVMLTMFASGVVFVWPQRGQEIEAQRGHLWVFDNMSDWAAQMAAGLQSLSEDLDGGLGCHWADVVHVYESPFKELGDLVHGLDYTLDSLKEIARVYGQPVTAQA